MYASDHLKAEREVVPEAIRAYGLALINASEALRADRDIVLEAAEAPLRGFSAVAEAMAT